MHVEVVARRPGTRASSGWQTCIEVTGPPIQPRSLQTKGPPGRKEPGRKVGARTPQVVPVVKNPPDHAGEVRDLGSIPRWGRSPGGGDGNPLQRSCLGNPMDRGAWRAAAHRVAESWTRLKRLSTHTRRQETVSTRTPDSLVSRPVPKTDTHE